MDYPDGLPKWTTLKWTTPKKSYFATRELPGTNNIKNIIVLPLQYKELTVNRLTKVHSRLTGVNSRLTGVHSRLTGVKSRLTRVHSRLTVVSSSH